MLVAVGRIVFLLCVCVYASLRYIHYVGVRAYQFLGREQRSNAQIHAGPTETSLIRMKRFPVQKPQTTTRTYKASFSSCYTNQPVLMLERAASSAG